MTTSYKPTEALKSTFSDCALAAFDLSFTNVDDKGNQFSIKPSFTTYSVLNLTAHYQTVAIVSEAPLGEDFILIPACTRQVVQSIIEGKTTDGGQIFLGGDEFASKNLGFNGSVYIFAPNLSGKDAEVTRFLAQQGLQAKIRDAVYFDRQWENRAYDLFISHDSKDKQAVAEPLYHALSKEGLKVWLDKFELKLGDSLTEQIGQGIRDCKHGLLILSKNFLSNERWAKRELQSFSVRDAIEGQSVIIPVWHDITEQDLAKTGNHWLIDKVGGRTDDWEELIRKILVAVPPPTQYL